MLIPLYKRLFYLSLLLLLSISNVSAQEGKNPFDLEFRLEESDDEQIIEADEHDPNTTIIENGNTKNPFDINKRAPSDKSVSSTPLVKKQAPIKNTFSKVNAKDSLRFTSWMITLMMLFLTLAVTIFKTLIGKVYRAFMNENFLKMIHREEKGIVSFPYIILYSLFFINAGIFIFLIIRHFQVSLGTLRTSQLYTLMYCILGIAGFFVLKHFFLMIFAYVFPVSKEIKQYSFTIIIFSIILGFVLAPLDIFIAFAPTGLRTMLIYLTITIIVAIHFG